MEERQKRRKHSRGVCEGTGQATRLRKSGKKRGRVRVLGWWATRLWKRGKKKRRGMCEGTGWATRLRKRGKKMKKKGSRRGRVRVLGGLLG